ncbi:MFS transporter [Amycolatopsis regifaucium]|uniref:MFS transporter n=1 Tax=Amycolatopsis regifaucium TaxID=546365 RepID=A0A154ML63_9PSEU|nr:aromatic acid/H+ symport family MFS transporter [Amycolatopsis regifaucium]KZB85124.1 MFS transporter [Amycolatopsis regifaucium]OKA04147.1 MFS transporter [Amycolatopsis regifaucium]SFH93163.1 Predicted arabinose efflux permease, MFS family [Amycolatopsis regifaucium]
MSPVPARSWVVPLAWTAVLLDGFDLVVLGTVLPALLRDHVWGLTPGTASVISTFGLIGMMIGAMAIGTITDLIGRRKALIIAVTAFSACTALCAIAPSAFFFGLFRFLAGLGLGGCLPTAIALVTEYARKGKGGSATTTVMTGYHVGAVLTALLGIWLIQPLGWRAMFVAGALPALVLVPLMFKYLPESESFERARETQEKSAVEVVGGLFRGGLLRATIAFWVTSFMGLLLVYGLNTWLPEIMRQAGYPLGAALGLLLTLNLGGVAGLLVAGRVADKVGVRPSVISWFLGAAVFLALLSVKLPAIGLYVAVFLTGGFVFSAQVLVYAYIGKTYPAAMRATGIGWAAGVGRIGAICGPILGGALLTAGIAYPWGFYAFAAVGGLGAAAVTGVRAGRAQEPATPVP